MTDRCKWCCQERTGMECAYDFCVTYEAYQQGRADAIDECANSMRELAYKWFERGKMGLDDIQDVVRQLKEQNNG